MGRQAPERHKHTLVYVQSEWQRHRMASDRSKNLQDVFLRYVQEKSVPVTIFLVNGVKLQGYIAHFDKFGVALTREQHTQSSTSIQSQPSVR